MRHHWVDIPAVSRMGTPLKSTSSYVYIWVFLEMGDHQNHLSQHQSGQMTGMIWGYPDDLGNRRIARSYL